MSINPYALQIMQQSGCTEREAHKSNPSQARSFPCTIYGRYFATQSEYDEALAEFLMSNWLTALAVYDGYGFLCSTSITSMYKLFVNFNGVIKPMTYAPCPFNVAQARLNHYRAVFPSNGYSMLKIVPGCDWLTTNYLAGLHRLFLFSFFKYHSWLTL